MKAGLLKYLFPLICIILLTPWPIAYAYAYSPDSESATPETVQVTAAQPENAPGVNVFSEGINAVTPGDLFYIDAIGNAADIEAILYLTNAQDLVHDYRYVILQVSVYKQDSDGQWQKAYTANGQEVAEGIISLLDSQATFKLQGLANYKITIDSGSINSFCFDPGQGNSSQPRFFLKINQP